MHVVVIGAGIIGLTTAYYLSREGYEVTVLDMQDDVGLSTSKANGAQLSYNFVAPLAEPSVLKKVPGWLLDKDSPLRLRLRASTHQWRWLLKFLSVSGHRTFRQGTADLLALGLHSRRLMHSLLENEKLAFHFSRSGKLLVYEDQTAFRAAVEQSGYQASLGSKQDVLDRDGCINREPALTKIAHRIAGGIYTPSEETADCLLLCRELRRVLEPRTSGVRFVFNTEVFGVRQEKGRVVALHTSQGDVTADTYVLANGAGAQQLAKPLGMDLLIYPLKGYSLTYDLTPASVAPEISVSDIRNKVVYARLGNQLRVAGMVDIGYESDAIDISRVSSLQRCVEGFFPDLNPSGKPQQWAGLRPARPDSKPLIGKTFIENLWVNVGHGALGFTLAAGSAGFLVDQLAGRRCDANLSAFMFS